MTAELRALLARATKGRAFTAEDGLYAGQVVVTDGETHATVIAVDPDLDDRPEDRALHVALRNSAEALLDAVDAARELTAAQDALDLADAICPCDRKLDAEKRDGHYSSVCPYLMTQRARDEKRKALIAALARIGGERG